MILISKIRSVFLSFFYLQLTGIQEGFTALLRACANGKVDVVRVLLDQGAEADIQDNVSPQILMAISTKKP